MMRSPSKRTAKPAGERNHRIRSGKLDHYDVEKRYVRKDGSVIWVALSASTIRDSGGTPIFNIRQVQDITEKKRAMEAVRESEARFRAVIDNSAAAINLKNIDGEYLLVNRAFEDFYQINGEQTHGKTVFDVFPPPSCGNLCRNRSGGGRNGNYPGI